MSMFRRRLLIMMATNLPNSPIRFIDGSIAVFCDGRTGYFPLDSSVRDIRGGRVYFNKNRIIRK